MGKLVFLLLVAFVCSAFGGGENLKFKPYVGDFEDDLSQDKVNHISLGNDNEDFMEDDLNDDEEPTEDVDGEDEDVDKAALEEAVEDKMASLEWAQIMRFADQDNDNANDETDLAKTEGTGKSVDCRKHHHHRHCHRRHRYRHCHRRHRYRHCHRRHRYRYRHHRHCHHRYRYRYRHRRHCHHHH